MTAALKKKQNDQVNDLLIYLISQWHGSVGGAIAKQEQGEEGRVAVQTPPLRPAQPYTTSNAHGVSIRGPGPLQGSRPDGLCAGAGPGETAAMGVNVRVEYWYI